MTTHLQARAILVQAWPIALGHRVRTPSGHAVHAGSVCARSGSGYGNWPLGPMKGSNNWGCIQSTQKALSDGSAPPGTAWATDTHPTAIRGKNVPYPQLFRTYPTPLDGCVDVLRWFAHQHECLDEADSGIVFVSRPRCALPGITRVRARRKKSEFTITPRASTATPLLSPRPVASRSVSRWASRLDRPSPHHRHLKPCTPSPILTPEDTPYDRLDRQRHEPQRRPALTTSAPP